MTYCEEATSVLPDVSFTLHADGASNGTAACMPARAPLAHIANSAVSLSQCRTSTSPRTGYGAQDARLGTMHRKHSWTSMMYVRRGGSRLEALAAVADPGLAEVADGAHQRHACGILPSMRHTAVPSKTPACADVSVTLDSLSY